MAQVALRSCPLVRFHDKSCVGTRITLRKQLQTVRFFPVNRRCQHRWVPRASFASGEEVAEDDLPAEEKLYRWVSKNEELRVLVLGKTGTGKSSLINSLLQQNATVGDFDVGTTQVDEYYTEERPVTAMAPRIASYFKEQGLVKEAIAGKEITCVAWDTPGFFDVQGRTPAGVLRELSGKVDAFDVILYCQPANDPRVRLEDEQSISFVVAALAATSKPIEKRVVVALTFANQITPDRFQETLENKCNHVRSLFSSAIAQLRESLEAQREEEGLEVDDLDNLVLDAIGEEHIDIYAEASEAASSIRMMAAGAGGESLQTAEIDACGGGGDQWEDRIMDQLIGAASEQPRPARMRVNWSALTRLGIVSDAELRPLPPMELVNKYVDLAVGTFDNSLQVRTVNTLQHKFA